MTGTAPRPDEGPCDEHACHRPYGHRGAHMIRRCARAGCDNPTRNAEERHCVRHETRETYERYTDPRDGSPRRP